MSDDRTKTEDVSFLVEFYDLFFPLVSGLIDFDDTTINKIASFYSAPISGCKVKVVDSRSLSLFFFL